MPSKWMPRASASARARNDQPYNWRVFWSYLPDWILTIFLWGVFYLLDKIDGYRRLFSVTDESLAHPFAEHERVPVWALALIAGIFPALVIVFMGALYRSFWDVHTGLLGFILALGLGVTFTDILKITVGRPRPDLFSRCGLPENLTENPRHGLTSWTVCTKTDELQEGFRSFPSGHSSFAWSGMWYLELYLMAKLRTSNQRGYTYKSWLLLIPVSAASLVSVSRTMDYRHHATDVIAGAIIGVLTAWWAYRQYYPAVISPKSWKPYSPRIPRDDALPMHDVSHQGSPTNDRSPLQRTTHNGTGTGHGNGNVMQQQATYPPQQQEGYAPQTSFDGGSRYETPAFDAPAGGHLPYPNETHANNYR